MMIKTKKTDKVVAACPAGLGNRIKCIMSTMELCDELKGKDVNAISYVYWPVNAACGCKFEDLFEDSSPLIEMGRSELYGVEVDAEYGEAYINKSWKLKTEANIDMDFKYHGLKRSQINKFIPHLWNLHIKKDIVDSAKTFHNKHRESFDKEEVIGVHIRKGDFKGLYDGRSGISQESDFIERMRCLLEVNPDYKFLLCTEDEETEEIFRKRFGSNHIIYFPKKFRTRNEPNAIKEAFIDILLLSECPIIIGTFLSTFTEIAWWIGGCGAQVVIPGAENKEAVAKVTAKLPQEGEGIHKKIWRKLMTWKTEGL